MLVTPIEFVWDEFCKEYVSKEIILAGIPYYYEMNGHIVSIEKFLSEIFFSEFNEDLTKKEVTEPEETLFDEVEMGLEGLKIEGLVIEKEEPHQLSDIEQEDYEIALDTKDDEGKPEETLFDEVEMGLKGLKIEEVVIEREETHLNLEMEKNILSCINKMYQISKITKKEEHNYRKWLEDTKFQIKLLSDILTIEQINTRTKRRK